MLLTLGILTAFISFFICRWIRDRSEDWGLIDIPNQRSSHERPTPKGGGIGIVIAMVIALSLTHILVLPLPSAYGVILCGAMLMALLGFFSDRRPLSPFLRLGIQGLIAIGVLAGLDFPRDLLIVYRWHIGVLSWPLGVIWLVAVTNFYNFMDGIDGLAAMQAVAGGVGLMSFGILLSVNPLVPAGLYLSAASLGFLVWNFIPRKIFMGDVGSYFIGFYLAAFGMLDPRLLVPVALVLGVFIADTVVTLFIRISRRERWYQAHRSHFYQRAVRLGYSHCRVTGFLSVVFLVLTILAGFYIRNGELVQIMVLGLAVMILFASALWVVAMERERRRDSAES